MAATVVSVCFVIEVYSLCGFGRGEKGDMCTCACLCSHDYLFVCVCVLQGFIYSISAEVVSQIH